MKKFLTGDYVISKPFHTKWSISGFVISRKFLRQQLSKKNHNWIMGHIADAPNGTRFILVWDKNRLKLRNYILNMDWEPVQQIIKNNNAIIILKEEQREKGVDIVITSRDNIQLSKTNKSLLLEFKSFQLSHRDRTY